MLLLNNQLTQTPVMSLQNGSELGVTTQTIIDPRKLQVIGFYVSGPRIHSQSILHASDIREVGPLGFIVDSADNIMELDESLVRTQEVIGFNFLLLEKTVIDENKKKIGKVAEYTVESEGFFVQKLHVGQSIIKNFSHTGSVIHRSQILEVTDKHIIVKSTTVPVTTGLTQALNPFRKSQSFSPEASRIKTSSQHAKTLHRP